MSKIYILCIDDEPEVLDAVIRDLGELEDVFPIESASSADEARKRVEQIYNEDDAVGLLLCDHVMPGENGVDLLVSLHATDWTRQTRKVLVTGQAGLDATILAVNSADLHHYIAKPWTKEDLLRVVKEQLTDYIIETKTDPMPYMGVLNAVRLSNAIRSGGLIGDG